MALTGRTRNPYGFIVPYESLRAGKTWRNSGVYVGTVAASLTSVAYCG